MFHMGQKVVCIKVPVVIDDDCLNSPRPQKGEVCTVIYVEQGGEYIGLAEYLPGDCFLATLFRPVHETDISIFTAMLNKVKTPELI